ncbi:peptidylprolyl isomerase [Owenweeksia hongkongensis]|uniref:peptidylprolyl isomerase n=1 Tax=Owenweeksia hongkongensis TaxID=253245 RepID=UPI003A8CB716
MKKFLLAVVFLISTQAVLTAQTKVTIYTTLGNFDVEMYDSLMPITAGNFLSLVNSKYYDGVIFHRVIKNFVIQGGDPTGTGSGGPGYTIPDEFDSTGVLSNTIRTIAMANSGPNSGGSQFFINLKNNAYLDYDKAPLTSAHPVFAIVRDGWNIVDSIANVSVNSSDRPMPDVVMDSVRVTGRYIGVVEIDFDAPKVEVSPNPFVHEIKLSGVELRELKAISIYSVDGVLVKEIVNPQSLTISMEDVSAGTYMIHTLYKNGRQGMGKVVKSD